MLPLEDRARTFSLAVARARDLVAEFQRGADAIDHPDGYPTAELAALHHAGLLAAPLAEGLGGIGLGLAGGDPPGDRATGALVDVLEEVGRGSLPLGRIYEGHVNALLLLQQHGHPDQVAGWAERAREGAVFGVWNSQDHEGLLLADGPGPGSIGLDGSKTYASGAGHVRCPIVTAKRPGGPTAMVIVPVDEVEIAIDPSGWRPLGMRATASHRVTFAGVRLPARRCLLGSPGAYTREPWFSLGAIRFAAVQVGGARALLEATVAALRALGRADSPQQRARVGTMAIAVESGRQWVRAAAALVDAAGPDPDRVAVGRLIAHAQMTRTAVEAACQDVIRLAEQSIGIGGLLQPHPVERIGRDLTTYLRQPGIDATLDEVGRAYLDGVFPPDLPA